MTDTQRNHAIAEALVSWFQRCGKDYPWRRTTDPWAILVSEIMLQQTTIPTVLARYEAWLRLFPTPADLARATEQEALRSWEGLGYYRRVRSLRAVAAAVCERYGGQFPTAHEELLALPGIGDYTAGAVRSFAFNLPSPIVDANVSRVIARLDNDPTPIDSTEGRKRHWRRAAEILDRERPRLFNSAIMELGQTYCLPSGPVCLLCPCRELCRAEDPASLPVKTVRPAPTLEVHYDLLCVANGNLLMEKQAGGKRHEGMYRLPRRTEGETQGLKRLATQKYSVTRYRITRHLFAADEVSRARAAEEWIPLANVEELPMASPDRKLLRRFLPGSGK